MKIEQQQPTLNSKAKPPSCLFTQIEKLNPGMILGLEFQIYSDELTEMKAHVSTLFALLYLYGEKEHKEIMIKEIKKKMPSSMTFNMEEKEEFYECVKKMKEVENIDKYEENKNKDKNEICQLFVLSFLLKELKRNNDTKTIKKFKIYSNAELEILKWAFLYIFEEDLENMLTFNSLSITKMLSKLLNITCTIKNYYEFEIIELTCELFEQKNIEIFIETSKNLKIRKFIKQKNIHKILNERQQNTQTIEEKLGCSSKILSSGIIEAFKGDNSFIFSAVNTSFEQILRVEDSIEVDDDDEEYEDQNSIESIQISGSELTEEPIVAEINKMIKERVFGKEVKDNLDEDEFMDESISYSKTIDEQGEESYIEESIVYNKSNEKSEESYMEESIVISHKNKSEYKISEINESFVKEFKLEEEKMNEFDQKGSESCSSGKNKANTRESEKNNIIDYNENRKNEFLTEEQMKIISIKSDEIKSPNKIINQHKSHKLYLSNNILNKNEVHSEDEEFFTNKIDQNLCFNYQTNFCKNEKFDDSLIINEGVNDFNFEESNQEFFEGISIIEQQKSINCVTKIGSKKPSEKSTATNESSENSKSDKKKVHFNKIPAENLLRETWILEYLDQIEKGEISFEYEEEEISECYSLELDSDDDIEETQKEKETHKETDKNLEKFVVNWANKVENSNKHIEIKELSQNQNELEFVRGVLGALFCEAKQEKIAKFIQNVRWRVNNRNKNMIKRGENIETYPEESFNSSFKTEQMINNVLNKKVGSFNLEKGINFPISSQNPNKKTMRTSICQELKSNYEMLHRIEKKGAKSQILQISRIDNEGLSIKSRQTKVQLQSYFSQ